MKRSKKVVAFTLAATMLFGNVVSVFAADGDVDSTNNKITFKSGDGYEVTDPVDPEDPDVNITPDPEKEKPTGNTGELRLDVVPAFDFGTQEITTKDKSYDAELPVEAGGDKVPYYVQVTDVSGTGEGWKIKAKLTDQFSDGTHELNGAAIILSNVAAESQTGTVVPSSVNSGTLQNDGSSLKIAAAQANEGMGVTAVRFGDTPRDGRTSDTAKESVNLTIPAETQVYKSTYKATIKWTLEATPD